jgi:hypothetical protein
VVLFGIEQRNDLRTAKHLWPFLSGFIWFGALGYWMDVSAYEILTAPPRVKYKDILLSKNRAPAMNGLATAHDCHTLTY